MIPTLTHTPQLLGATVAESLANAVHATGLGYAPTLSEKSNPIGKLAWLNRYLELAFRRHLYALQFHAEATSTPLTIAVLGGIYAKSDGTEVTFAGNATVLIPDATTARKVYIDTTTNAVAQAASWPADASTYVPLCEVDTAAGAVTELRDARGKITMRPPSAASDLGQTNQTVFTIDADNAGAAADCELRVNRGSSAAEDASIKWLEASALFRLLALHATGTRAGLDCAKVQIAGADVLDASGTLVASALATARLYVFGANGSTPYGLALTPAGASGAPTSGAHVAGELHFDSAAVLWICTAAGSPGTWARVADQLASPAAGVVSAAALSNAVADGQPYVTITSSTGSGATHSVTLQLKDMQGNNLAEAACVELGVYDDADGATASVAHSISGAPLVGTFLNWVTANKVGRYKTSAAGTLTLDVTMASVASVTVIAASTRRGRTIDCALSGTVTRT